MKRWILVLLAVAAVMVPGRSFALLGLVSVEGAVGGFMPSPSGSIQFDGGTDGDVESRLGFDDEAFATARLRVELPLVLPNIYLMATPMEFDGNITGTFNFGGYDFTDTANADASLTFNQYDVGLFYGVPFLGVATLGRVGIDFGLNVRMIELEAEMTEPGGEKRTESVDVPVPLLFAAAQLNLIGGFALEAELRGLDVDYARVVSAIARVKYETMGPLFVAAGYRHEEVAVDKDDIEVDITFAGPFAEAGFSF